MNNINDYVILRDHAGVLALPERKWMVVSMREEVAGRCGIDWEVPDAEFYSRPSLVPGIMMACVLPGVLASVLDLCLVNC